MVLNSELDIKIDIQIKQSSIHITRVASFELHWGSRFENREGLNFRTLLLEIWNPPGKFAISWSLANHKCRPTFPWRLWAVNKNISLKHICRYFYKTAFLVAIINIFSHIPTYSDSCITNLKSTIGKLEPVFFFVQFLTKLRQYFFTKPPNGFFVPTGARSN